MNCPLCNVALKVAGHRGLTVDYCPLCGGTWLDRYWFDRVSSAARTPRRPARRLGRLLRIGVLTALVLAVCLVVTIPVGVVRLWPNVRSWAEAVFRSANPQIARLSNSGLDAAAIASLLRNSEFDRLLSSVAAAPDLAPLLRNGGYLQALQEATRQNVPNLADLKLDAISAQEVRSAAEQLQAILRRTPAAQTTIGAVNPGVVALLETEPVRQLCRAGFFESQSGRSGGAEKDQVD